MDESALQSRLAAVERRQYVIIALLLVPYAYWLGTKIGFWTVGVAAAVLAVVGFAALVVSRRRGRNATGS